METTPTKSIIELRQFAEQQLLQGISADEVKSQLLNEGLEQDSADAIINSLTQGASYYKNIDRLAALKEAPSQILFGALLFVGGLAIIITTYYATSGQATFLAAWVAMIVGCYNFIKGILNSRKP